MSESGARKRDVYVVWANKGGVGKTTLTFHLSTVFAEENPDWKVLVCDMCPQANISMTFLADYKGTFGGDASTPPKTRSTAENVSTLHYDESASYNASTREGAAALRNICHTRLTGGMENYQTVGGYIQSFVSRRPEAKREESAFVIEPCKFNSSISDNMFLICGDTALDVSCERLDQYRRMDPGAENDDPWLDGTLALRDLIHKACDQIDENAKWAVFIDTNPALTTYTQLALVAGDFLLIPVNADDFSEVAVAALFNILYHPAGTGDSSVRYSKCQKLTFAYKAREKGLPLPKIRLVIHNRQSIYGTRSAEAFSQIGDVISSTLCRMFKKHPERFVDGKRVLSQISTSANSAHTQRDSCLSGQSSDDKFFNEFRKAYTANMKDFHTPAVVCTHTGKPLSKLPLKSIIYHQTEKKVSLKKDQVEKCRQEVVLLLQQLPSSFVSLRPVLVDTLRPPVDRQPVLLTTGHQAVPPSSAEEEISTPVVNLVADEFPSSVDDSLEMSTEELVPIASGSPAYDTIMGSSDTAEETNTMLEFDPDIFSSRVL